MTLSRRRLIQGLAGAAGVLVMGGGGLLLARHRVIVGARQLYHGFADPPLPDAPPGPLDGTTLAALRAAAESLVGEPGGSERYLAPFHWRAAHRPGYRETYRRFARSVDAGAQRAGARRFADLDPAAGRRLLSTWFPSGRVRHFVTGWAAPQRQLLRRHVVEAILSVYAQTDAWVDLGYEGWPGQPRDLDAYRDAPPGALATGRSGRGGPAGTG